MNQKLKEVSCECGKNAWVQTIQFGQVPALLSENGKAGLAPLMTTFVCCFCAKSIEDTEAFKEMQLASPLIK